MPKYKTKPIDYTGCDPVIAEHLKKGEAIYCKCWDDYEQDFKYAYVIIYNIKQDLPYKAEFYCYKHATPVLSRTRVKKASEIVKWLEDNGYRVNENGSWVHFNFEKLTFSYIMFQYCGKESSDTFDWLDEWLEEY